MPLPILCHMRNVFYEERFYGVAGDNDLILVCGPLHLVDNSPRYGLKTKRLIHKNYDQSKENQLIQNTDYAIIPSRMNQDIIFFSDKPTVFSVPKMKRSCL